MKMIYDCYMLLHTRYSGISNITLMLLQYFLEKNVNCIYSIGYRILSDNEIESFIYHKSGINSLFDVVLDGFHNHRFLSQRDFNERLYFSPHTFSCSKINSFASVRIIHDITPIIFPQFHTSDVNQQEGMNLLEDIKQADQLITISEASKIHIQKYLGVTPRKIIVCKEGIGWSQAQIENCSKAMFDFPYVLILGTLEPRKNIALLFEYLFRNMNTVLSEETRYVISGQNGWGNVIEANTIRHLQPLIDANKLIFSGYIPDEYKMSLLAGAKYLLYPSFCEGFGLPVLEALSVGTPVVCSFGGSIPEAGGNVAFYFSPFDIDSMEYAINNLESELLNNRAKLRKKCIDYAQKLTASNFCNKVDAVLRDVYSRKCKS